MENPGMIDKQITYKQHRLWKMCQLKTSSDIITGYLKSLILSKPNKRAAPEPQLQSETTCWNNTSTNLRL